MNFGFSGSNNIAIDHVQVVAFYDHINGKIKHVHMVTTLVGGVPVTEYEAINEAKRLAQIRNPNIDDFGIALSNNPIHGNQPHFIDLKTKSFLPLNEKAN